MCMARGATRIDSTLRMNQSQSLQHKLWASLCISTLPFAPVARIAPSLRGLVKRIAPDGLPCRSFAFQRKELESNSLVLGLARVVRVRAHARQHTCTSKPETLE